MLQDLHGKKVLRVINANMVLVIKAHMAANRTFKVELKVMDCRCIATSINIEEWIWHYSLGYLNFRYVNALQ